MKRGTSRMLSVLAMMGIPVPRPCIQIPRENSTELNSANKKIDAAHCSAVLDAIKKSREKRARRARK